MRLDKNNIKKILVITLSNLGDIILTTPVIEVLLREFPEAELDVMVGPRGIEVFEKHPKINEVIVYDKFRPLLDKLRLILKLRKRKYTLAVDLRNTLIPYLIGASYKSLPFKKLSRHVVHKKDVHLWKLRTFGINITNPHYHLYISQEDRMYINNILKNLSGDRLVVVSAGARSDLKRWRKEGFVYVINRLRKESSANIVMIGSTEDAEVSSSILNEVGDDILNLTGKTTVRQLIALLEKTDLLITNDSAPLHMASILGKRVLAIFGPMNPREYGPFSKGSIALHKPIVCQPCRKAHCKFNHECMYMLRQEKVFEVAKSMLKDEEYRRRIRIEPRRILLIRTDRIGDVVLSTPVIKTIYETYVNSVITFMVRPYTKELVEGNPYLDEVIVLDKKRLRRRVWGTMKFAWMLKRKKFDMAIILHPTNRVHIVTFLAGIPERIGYDKKMGFLLTKRIPHVKQLGQKHELEYTLDILKAIGIESVDRDLLVPLDEKADKKVDELLFSSQIEKNDIVIGIHPGASCPSKRWEPQRFAELANRIIEEFGVKVAIITGPSDANLGNKIALFVKHNMVNLSGVLSVKELTSLLKRCRLFISNDSGPVHIAVAVGTPVISIFGRNEKGLSPTRWKPLGKDDMVIHKDVGCKECLAHDCKIGFRCLEEISVDEVLSAVYKFKDRLQK